jgi:hypothetical protein
MIIYTPVPPEILWYEEGKEEVQLIEGAVEGIPVQLKVMSGHNPVVERVLSTDPAHFLKSACQPGNEINGDCAKN